jgi:hypothetical protein
VLDRAVLVPDPHQEKGKEEREEQKEHLVRCLEEEVLMKG